jgi:hypothetical protein
MDANGVRKAFVVVSLAVATTDRLKYFSTPIVSDSRAIASSSAGGSEAAVLVAGAGILVAAPAGTWIRVHGVSVVTVAAQATTGSVPIAGSTPCCAVTVTSGPIIRILYATCDQKRR